MTTTLNPLTHTLTGRSPAVSSPVPPRDSLESRSEQLVDQTKTPSVQRILTSTVLASTLLVFVVVAVGFFATGYGAGYALGLGFYLAFWVGMGFGAMAAGGRLANQIHNDH
jgi:hypothetical protein